MKYTALSKLLFTIGTLTLAATTFAGPTLGPHPANKLHPINKLKLANSAPSHFQQLLSPTQYQQVISAMGGNPQTTPYTYASLSEAVDRWHAFNNSNDTENKLELAAFLANIAHETGNFVYTTEVACSNGTGTPKDPLPAACHYGGSDGAAYYGRGPMQLSWNYNYQAYNEAIHSSGTTNDAPNFLTNPDAVLQPTYLMDTGIWFWTKRPSGPSSQVASQVFQRDATTPGDYKKKDPFGESIRIINGGIECDQQPGSIGYNEAQSRIKNYKTKLGLFSLKAYAGPTVGQSCNPPPKPAPADALTLSYTGGDWAAATCYTDSSHTKTLGTVGLNQTAAIAHTGAEQDNSQVAYCNIDNDTKNATYQLSNGKWTATSKLGVNADCSGATCTFAVGSS